MSHYSDLELQKIEDQQRERHEKAQKKLFEFMNNAKLRDIEFAAKLIENLDEIKTTFSTLHQIANGKF